MSAEEFAGIGLAIGVVTGARSFKIDKLGRLTGIHYEQVWRPGENEAECRKRDNLTSPYSIGGLTWSVDTSALLRSMSHYLNYPVYTSTVTPSPSGLRTTVSIPAQTTGKKPRKGVASAQVNLPALPETVRAEPIHDMTECACGFYGYYDGSDDYHRTEYVSAVVEGYGETLIGTRGFRAMKSRIVALHIPEGVPLHLAKKVARNYSDIPMFATFVDMVAEFPCDGGDAAIDPFTDPDFWTRKV